MDSAVIIVEIHVADQQALAPPRGRQDDDIVRQLGRQRSLDGYSDLRTVMIVDRQLAGFIRRQPACRPAECPLQGRDGRAAERDALRIGDQTHDMDEGADCPRSPAAMQAAVR